MASEIRHIIFNDAELLRALSIFRIRVGKPMPPGTVKKFVVKKADSVQVHITLERLKDGGDTDLAFEIQEIAAALVMFCIHNNIPVPAAGFTKELDLTDGMVTLTVRSTLPTELVDTP